MVLTSKSEKNGIVSPGQMTKKKAKSRQEHSTSKVNELESKTTRVTRKIVCPENQLVLTQEELKEEIARILTADDPNVPRNISKFNYREKCFKLDPPGYSDHMAIHMCKEGCSLHIQSSEYHKQDERERKKEEENASRLSLQKESSVLLAALPEKHKNLFNYSERGSQTIHHPSHSRGVSTEQPPVTQYSANVSPWQIYDSYVSDLMIINMEHPDISGEKRKISFEDRIAIVQGEDSSLKDIVHSEEMAKALKITERLINQNAQDEIYHDFKYFEDASDQYKAREGSLLPLWNFKTQRTKKGQQVTSLCWNTYHDDLFAVGFGTYDFLGQGSGMVCCYSLKNTSNPEYSFSTESGVLCVDFHVCHPSLLAVGCYDGNVLVYNLRSHSTLPIFSSSVISGNHSDPVWEIHWEKETSNGQELNFYSISSDGKVTNWTLSRNELRMELVMNLALVHSIKMESDEPTLAGFACGSSFHFHTKQPHLFLVGTEEGYIHKCSKSYSGQYLETYQGHHMAVYSLRWNVFHDRVFLSCSADWTVKLWDQSKTLPLMTFDLGSAVGDICWSPFSSTVFAAVTHDGKVHVFDLSENKSDALCVQRIVKRSRLTKCSFHKNDFMLIVGDERGVVHSLKLSPNLRKVHTLSIDRCQQRAAYELKEADRMEYVLTTIDAKS